MKTRKSTTHTTRTSLIKFRCSSGEKEIIRHLARESGRKISEYCRAQALHGKVYAPRRFTPEERQYFIFLKDQNLGFARISNYIKNHDPELHHAIWEFLSEAKTLYNRFF